MEAQALEHALVKFPDNWMEALELAQVVHADHTRNGGEPYIKHLERVAKQTAYYADRMHARDEIYSRACIVALLHDSLEYNSTKDKSEGLSIQILDQFGPYVFSDVHMLTNPFKHCKQSLNMHMAYDIQLSRGSVVTRLVKTCDIIDNTSTPVNGNNYVKNKVRQLGFMVNMCDDPVLFDLINSTQARLSRISHDWTRNKDPHLHCGRIQTTTGQRLHSS